MEARGKFIIAIFMALLATALTGDQSLGVGFKKECIDGLDNDGDGFSDYQDPDCKDYPYDDGLGEVFTQIGADYQAEKYQYSLFDYRYLYSGQPDSYWCLQNTYDSFTVSFQVITNYSNGKDTAYADYVYWYAQNCP